MAYMKFATESEKIAIPNLSLYLHKNTDRFQKFFYWCTENINLHQQNPTTPQACR